MLDTLSRETLARPLPLSRRRVHAGPGPARLRLTRRGRLAILALAAVAVFLVFSVGHAMSNAATSSPQPAATHTIVVAPGDTAWSIAHAAMPHLDGREAVDRLLAMNHSDGQIQAGATLVVPGP